MRIRPARPSDLSGIAAIYEHYVAGTHATFDTVPPPQDHWEQWLASAGPGDHRLVAEGGDGLYGYAYSTRYRVRPAYDRTREVSVYLSPGSLGRGVGRALYDDLLPLLDADDVHVVLAGVALPNEASRALHRSFGFAPVGVMREVGRKLDRWIDVEWWQRTLR